MNKVYQDILYKEVAKIAGNTLGDETEPIQMLGLAIQDIEYRVKQLEKHSLEG